MWEGEDNGVCEVLLTSLSWVHEKLQLERSLHFNELVANEYDHRKDEYTPWHSDTSHLLADEALIVSITLDSPGVFCFSPNIDMLLHEFSGPSNEFVAFSTAVRGCVALLSRDVMVMCGSFEE